MKKEILVVLILFFGIVNAQLADSPWPKFRGDLENTGLSPYDTSHVDGTIKWEFEIGTFTESSPSVGHDGTIYVGSHDNNLYAINPDGSLNWVFDAGEPTSVDDSMGGMIEKGIMSSPAIAEDGTIYIRSLSQFLFAINPDGTEKWRFPIEVTQDTWSSPTIARDGTIYVGSSRSESSAGKMYAINPDGTKKWSFETESDVFPTAAINDDGTIYFGSGASGKLYALNPSGSLKWHFQTGKHIESSAAIGEDGTIYVGSWDDYFYAVNPDGTEKWKFKTGGYGIPASAAIGNDGTIYFVADDGNFYALDHNGREKWRYKISSAREETSSPAIGAEGTIYVGASTGFYAFNPDGTIKWHLEDLGSGVSPSIGEDGTVYSVSQDSVYAFTGSDEEALPDNTIDIIDIFEAPANRSEGLVHDGTYLWSTSIIQDTIYKLDPDTGELISSFPAPSGGPMDLAWDGEYLWNADYDIDKIYKLDTLGNVLEEFNTPGREPMGLTWDGEYLWHTDYTYQKIYKLDTQGNILYEFDSPGTKPHGLAWDGEYLWNSDAETFKIYKLDASGNVLETLDVPRSYYYPTGLAINGNILWMTARDTKMIYKIDISSFESDSEPVPVPTPQSSPGLADSPWPKFKGNSKNTGLSPYDTSHVDGTIKWIFETEEQDQFESSVSIGPDGTLYIGSHSNTLYAINPDGTLKWKFKAGERVYTAQHDDWKGILSSPAIAQDGTIYFTSLSHYLFALNSDGTEKWRYKIHTTAGIWSSPAIGPDGTIYVGASNNEDIGASGETIYTELDESMNGIFAINPDGTLKWKFVNEGDVFPSPAIGDDGTIYCGAADGTAMLGKVYAINPDGTLKWFFAKDEWHIESSTVIGPDGTIYFGSWNDYFYALNSNGREKWSYKTDGGIVATAAIGPDSAIYVSSNDKYLYAFNPDGTVKWKLFLNGGPELASSPAVGADGTIYLGSSWSSENTDTFFAVNPNGTIKWSYDVGGIGSSPAIGSDGTVYVASYNNYIYAFGRPDEANESEEVSELCEYEGISTTYDMPFQSYYIDEEFIGIDSTSPGLDNEGKVTDLEQLEGLTCLQYFEVGHEEISGDLSNLRELVDLEVINMHTNPEVHGDICSLSEATNLRVLVLAFNPEVYGDISCLENLNLEVFAVTYTNISGHISSLRHMTNLQALYLAGTNAQGDVSALSRLTNLEELVLSDEGTKGSLIYGDLSSLDNLQKLEKVALYNMNVDNCEHFTEVHPNIEEGGCSSTPNGEHQEEPPDGVPWNEEDHTPPGLEPGEWYPDENTDCMSLEYMERCMEFCSNHPEYCPGGAQYEEFRDETPPEEPGEEPQPEEIPLPYLLGIIAVVIVVIGIITALKK